jgi:hypothetical protein
MLCKAFAQFLIMGLQSSHDGKDMIPHFTGVANGPITTRAAVDRWIKARTKESWCDDWKSSKHGSCLRQWLPEISKSSMDVYDGLTRAESTVLVQLRTGKIAFNDYLRSIGVRDSPLCDCCGLRSQTTKHVLIDCTALDDLRHSIWNDSDSGIPSTVSRFLTDPKQVRKTAQLVLQAGLIPYLSDQPAAPTYTPPASNNQTPSGTSGKARS